MQHQDNDQAYLKRAVELALQAEAAGNLPVGALIVLDDQIIAEGWSTLLVPHFDPYGHAEMNALDGVDPRLWHRAREMTIYSTLEPCCMCFGRILLTEIGRVVFGASDPAGGSTCLLPHLPPYYQNGPVPVWAGPLLPDLCDPLYSRVSTGFRKVMGGDLSAD